MSSSKKKTNVSDDTSVQSNDSLSKASSVMMKENEFWMGGIPSSLWPFITVGPKFSSKASTPLTLVGYSITANINASANVSNYTYI